MRAIFIADAHLRQPQDQNYQNLLAFLDQQQGNLDGLFLLGDIFEFWIGYRYCVFSEHLPLLCRLQQLADSGCKIFYVEGNHDFNIGSFFSEKIGCQVIADQQIIDWDNQKIFICHGDLADPNDRGYRLMRAFWRSGLLKFISTIVPGDAAWRFGNSLCNLSRKRARVQRDPSRLVMPYAQLSLAQGADHFVCGHFHFPLQQQTPAGTITVLGDWIQQYSYLELSGEQLTLKSYSSVEAADISTPIA